MPSTLTKCSLGLRVPPTTLQIMLGLALLDPSFLDSLLSPDLLNVFSDCRILRSSPVFEASDMARDTVYGSCKLQILQAMFHL